MDMNHFASTLSPKARLIAHDDLGRPIASAADFAAAFGCRPEQVCKTILVRLQGAGDDFAAVLLPAPARVDLDGVAARFNATGARLASLEELRDRFDTRPNAVSPFRLGDTPVLADRAIAAWPEIYVSAGVAGSDVAIPPDDAVTAAKAELGDFSLPTPP